jgi:tRNA (guanine-N7-)-methyltransferase
VTGCVAAGSVHVFHVYFPDPWPKKRQRKRRLLDAVFLELLGERLETGGLLRIATDHPGYAEELAVLLQTVASFEELDWYALPAPPPTHYEIKYRREGRPIRRFLLRRRSGTKLYGR